MTDLEVNKAGRQFIRYFPKVGKYIHENRTIDNEPQPLSSHAIVKIQTKFRIKLKEDKWKALSWQACSDQKNTSSSLTAKNPEPTESPHSTNVSGKTKVGGSKTSSSKSSDP